MSHYAKWRETPRLEAPLKAAGWLGDLAVPTTLHSSVIGFLELLISLSDLATGLLDPILVLGGSVVLGDFLVDQKYLFEVGGKNKTFEQIKDVEDSFLAVDGIEIGSRNRIPLWMFGMLY